MELGKHCLQQDRYDSQNLSAAYDHFLAAYDLINHGGTPDPASSVLVLHQIMNVQME